MQHFIIIWPQDLKKAKISLGHVKEKSPILTNEFIHY